MFSKHADLELLELIRNGDGKRSLLELPTQWEVFVNTAPGKAFRSYVLIRLLKVQEQMITERESDEVARLQGTARSLKDMLRLMEPTGGREIEHEVSQYLKPTENYD